MKVEKFLKKLFRALNRSKINYMIIGGIAAMIYGRPRTTLDCDVMIDVKTKDEINKLIFELKKEGFNLSKKDALDAFKRKEHFNAYLNDSIFRVDFSFPKDSIDFFGFKRIKERKLLGVKIKMESAEDIILAKLKYGSPLDLQDVKEILKREKVDWKYLRERAKSEGLWNKLKKLKEL